MNSTRTHSTARPSPFSLSAFQFFSFLFLLLPSLAFSQSEAVKVANTGTAAWQFSSTIVAANSGTGANQFARGNDDRIKNALSLVRVTDYGADPSGVSDSTAAIMNAYSAMKSGDKRGLYFGPGTFLLTTFSSTTASLTPTAGVVALNFNDHEGDFVIEGGGGKIYTTASGSAQRMIQLLPAAGSINIIRDLTLERGHVDAPSGDVNALDGVLIMPRNNTDQVESIRFENCVFIDCHRAWSCGPQSWYGEGKLRRLESIGCHYLYPRGANSVSVGGGGQATMNGNWPNEVIFDGGLFDGAVGGDVTEVANQHPKDGLNFSFNKHVAISNVIARNFGAEGILHQPMNSIAFPVVGYTMPNVGEDVVLAIPAVSQADTTIANGTNVSLTGTSTNFFTVQGWVSGTVTLRNTGTSGNAAPATVFGASLRYLRLADADQAASISISNCELDGSAVTGYGSPALDGASIQNSRATIRDTIVRNCEAGIALTKWTYILTSPRGSTVSGLHFSSTYNSQVGVVASMDGVIVDSSVFDLSGGGSQAGVSLDGGTQHLIVNNQFYSRNTVGQTGIAVSATATYRALNNSFENMVATIGGAGSLASTGTNLALVVDVNYGNNTGLRRGTDGGRFSTIAGANSIASAGDIIDVMPGVYNERNILKSGVTLNLRDGAQIIYTGTSGSILDNTISGLNSSGTFTITGRGRFVNSATAGTNQHVIHCDQAGSVFNITAQELAVSGTNTSNSILRCVGASTFYINVPLATNPIAAGANSVITSSGTIRWVGTRFEHSASAGAVINNSGATIELDGCLFRHLSTGASTYPVLQSGGTLRLKNSRVETSTASRAGINMTGGTLILDHSVILAGSSATASVHSSSGTHNVISLGAFGNQPLHSNLTPIGGTFTGTNTVQ